MAGKAGGDDMQDGDRGHDGLHRSPANCRYHVHVPADAVRPGTMLFLSLLHDVAPHQVPDLQNRGLFYAKNLTRGELCSKPAHALPLLV